MLQFILLLKEYHLLVGLPHEVSGNALTFAHMSLQETPALAPGASVAKQTPRSEGDCFVAANAPPASASGQCRNDMAITTLP